MSKSEMTYEEAFTLYLLLGGPDEDLDTVAHRYLINAALAERISPGMMTITEKGRRDLVGYIEKNHAVFKQPGDPSKHWDRNSKLKDAYGTDIPVRLSEDHAAPTVMGSEQEMTYEEALTLHLLINEGHAEDDDTSAHRFIINSGFAERFEPGMMRVTESGVTRLGRYVEQHNPNFPSTSLRP